MVAELAWRRVEPPAQEPQRGVPILMIHGFASNAERNWEHTGWVRHLLAQGRTLILVDLPGHGASATLAAAPGSPLNPYRPSRIRAELIRIAQANGVDADHQMDILGYSFGARLSLELLGEVPELIHRMVLGGPGVTDHLGQVDLEAARAWASVGTPIAQPRTRALMHMAAAVPGNQFEKLFDLVEGVQEETFTVPVELPQIPLLIVVGDQDPLLPEARELAALAPHATLVELPGRNHVNTVTARAFKDQVTSFL